MNENKNSRILIAGMINLQMSAPIDSFPMEYCPITYPFFGVNLSIGGVCYNQALTFKGLGEKNLTLLGITGKDAYSDFIKRDLESRGISPEYVYPILRETCLSSILYDKQGRRRIFCDLKDFNSVNFLQHLNKEVTENRYDAAVISNSTCNIDLMKTLKSGGTPIITDVHCLGNIHDDYNRPFLENADILFLSDEYIEHGGKERFISSLRDRYHTPVIVMGRGRKGSLLLTDSGLEHIPAYSFGEVKNTVGAGDALLSSFTHFYLKGYSACEALRLASVYAGKIVSTDIPDRQNISEADVLQLAADCAQ